MKNIILIIILFFIILTFIELIKQNPLWWNNKVEHFINSNKSDDNSSLYTNLNKTNPLNITTDLNNSEIILKSSIPPKITLGIENNNSIDIIIAQYFTNNIIPALVEINYNSILLNKINTNKLDLAFVREYELLNYIKTINTNNIRVIMPTFNKYLIALTSANNNINYIEDINTTLYKLNINICYMNDDDLPLIKTIIELQLLSPSIKNKINYKRINEFKELEIRDIFIGLIIPEDEEQQIRDNKLKPIYYSPINRLPTREKRITKDIKVNEEDKDIIREFHYDLKGYFDWLMETEIFPIPESLAYRTYKVRFILICNINSRLGKENFRTLINNWWAHRMPLKNIYHVSPGIKRGYPKINDTFTDLAAISPKLKFYPEMKIFLENKKLISFYS
jgi:hypothetical protein